MVPSEFVLDPPPARRDVSKLPKCGAEGCDDYADPRWYIHGPMGNAVMACDGHGMICNGSPCKCPLAKKDLGSVWARLTDDEDLV